MLVVAIYGMEKRPQQTLLMLAVLKTRGKSLP